MDDTAALVTLSDAAKLLGRDQRQIYRYIRDGRLTKIVVGRHSMLRRAEVEALRDRPVVQTDRQARVSASSRSGVSQSDLVLLLREQTAKVEAYAHRIGQLEAQLQIQEARLKLLEAPKEPEAKRPRWQFWR